MSVHSELSKASQASQQVFDDISKTNQIVPQFQCDIDNTLLNQVWNAFGTKQIQYNQHNDQHNMKYNAPQILWNLKLSIQTNLGQHISKSLRIGRAVSIPKYGLFTFSAPEFTMEGTTNQQVREIENREPIFILSKDFAKGMDLIPAFFRESGLTPIVLSSTAGKIQTQMCNYSDISNICQIDKETCKMAIDRIIKKLDQYCKSRRDSILMEIPMVGTFIVRKQMASVYFNQYLHKDIKGLLKLNIKERKDRFNNLLTSDKLKQLSRNGEGRYEDDQHVELSSQAKDWLASNLNIDISTLMQMKSESRSSQRSTFHIHSKSQHIETRDLNQKGQEDTANKLVDISQNYKAKTSDETKFKLLKSKSMFSLDNIVLKKLRDQIKGRNQNLEDAYFQLVQSIYGINAKLKNNLNKEQFMLSLNKLKYDFFDFELENLFKVIDYRNDHYVDYEEWTLVVDQEKSPAQWIYDALNKFSITLEDILKQMQIKRTDSPLNIDQLAFAFRRFHPGLGIEKGREIARYILKQNSTIEVPEFIEFLESQKVIRNQKGQMAQSSQFGESNRLDDNEHAYNQNCIQQIMIKIKNYIKLQEDPECIKKLFQNIDLKNQGYLDKINFQNVLMLSKIGITRQEIDLLSQNIEIEPNGMVDYQKFLKRVDYSLQYSDPAYCLENIADTIKNYMRQHNQDEAKFISLLADRKLEQLELGIDNSNRLKVDVFAQLLSKKVFPSGRLPYLVTATYIIDIDKDGFIDKYDLQTFLQRYHYLEEQMQEMPMTIQTDNKITLKSNNFLNSSNQKAKQDEQEHFSKQASKESYYSTSQLSNSNSCSSKLFPTIPLNDLQLSAIMKDLQQILTQRRLNLHEAFKILDTNNDGLVTVTDFIEGMDKWIKCSRSIKEGLFAYFDNQKIGMFDYARWHNIMQRYVIEKQQIQEDNFDWVTKAIDKLKNWYKQRNLSSEDAFKLMDFDFDGFLSKEDIKKFLIKMLQYQEQEINSPNIDRLFKVLDFYKRGYIQKSDIQKILQSGTVIWVPVDLPKTSVQQDTMNTFTNTTQNNTDWFKNVCQQMSYRLTKNHNSIKESFEHISKHQPQINYSEFKSFIDSSLILEGFNLTEKLLQKLFSLLDPHTKGYITENDWINAFSPYLNQQMVPLNDIKDYLKTQFKDSKEAFDFFCNSNLQNEQHKRSSSVDQHVDQKLDYEHFKQAISSLFQQVYNENNIESIWNQMLKKSGLNQDAKAQITLEQFQKLFYSIQLDLSRLKPLKRSESDNRLSNTDRTQQLLQNTSATNFYPSSGKLQQPLLNYSNAVFDKIKNYIIASGKNMEEEFQQIDKENTGIISTVEFKNLLMRLNLGISQQDIQLVIRFCTPDDPQQINWKRFLNKIKLNQNELQLAERSLQQIKKLKRQLYSYALSPKDAFIEFDKKKAGFINFQEFQQFLTKLAIKSEEEMPPFGVIKDMYEFIDQKKDNVIDLDEWMQTFVQYEQNSNVLNNEHTKSNQRYGSSNLIRSKLQRPRTQQSMNLIAKNIGIGQLYHSDQSVPLKWERSQQYDDVIRLIAKSRKTLIDEFKKQALPLSTNSSNQDDQFRYVTPQIAKEVFSRLFKKNNIQINENNWPVLLNFAERRGLIDFKFALEVFKQRLNNLDSHPLINQQ